ncbi:non-ribosomal peptide synthetase [Streptomyces chromofuscus]|uniref:Amino acid adenylation domain-containing protein n=1 Tax=Streptomyces chromofuscus TaxID=42881 RepID=A0A7M2T9Q9_STRCW|nr:amino acid adenylation domain-containing protein [Streptomyces chromofuscus]QOV45400.1 amino acid adenylation domain-containing protein [Streptomyces chromofuscus]GGS97857.1 amino acid adenylation protein [Streptomyces chromofuscus]
MDYSADASRDFWRGVLTAGGVTRIPRWTRAPEPGTAEVKTAVPHDVLTGLRRLPVPPETALLAAHAKVLAALSGEQEVTTGLVTLPGARPLPCRLTTAPRSWRALVRRTRAAESELVAHQEFPVDALARELRHEQRLFETVCDPTGVGGASGDGLAEGTVLRVGAVRHGDRLALLLRYRTDVLDADCAARIAGYHLVALTSIAADPDAEHGRQSLLSPQETAFQLDGLAGPRRELPDRRVHELFEERVRLHPDAVAVAQGNRQWTYGELNSRANRLSRALLVRGLEPEGVVAVVTERTLEWAVAVLGVLKAGGAYLPVEPHFPPERIAAMLHRAGCRLALTGRGPVHLPPDVRALRVEDACAEAHADDDPPVAVAAGQLAYIFFTSGSTGEPKGAMCEHAGFVNHVLAKIDDLGIGEGQVVAQTAPQCFDISLWQLVAALTVGGRTLLVEQEAILDTARFVDTVARGRVNVLQLVPSYLETVLAELEQHPRPLPDLRCVSATGEALKAELVRRWFRARPATRLVNAYGLTETSDDTNHEVMDEAPAHDSVPLGRPVGNVHVYVVDEHLAPVPLGAPGEIVFSGICVGRGYVGDPERTMAAFTEDPHRPGRRLYRSGDRGRWLPDGKLEYLGRRDTQVKIRGFRIEIGEIENVVLRTPGVRECAVVVAGGGHLVAFCAGQRPVPPDALRDRLTASLPGYMIPSSFHWRDQLPLTANGKTDRAALTALAEELDTAGDDGQAPGTPAERRLAAAWAEVLGIPPRRIGRRDHFFDRGGTSLSAVRLAIALDRAVDVKDITRHPVLADLARLLDGGTASRTCVATPSTTPSTPA